MGAPNTIGIPKSPLADRPADPPKIYYELKGESFKIIKPIEITEQKSVSELIPSSRFKFKSWVLSIENHGKIDAFRKFQKWVTPENHDFRILKVYGSQLGFQIHIFEKRADPSSGVCHNSAWSPSYEKKVPFIFEIQTTPWGTINRGPLKAL